MTDEIKNEITTMQAVIKIDQIVLTLHRDIIWTLSLQLQLFSRLFSDPELKMGFLFVSNV